MTTWEEIRDEVAGMLADGQPLEDVITKLEERKNEMAKANLIAVMDEMKKPKPMTNEEYLRSAGTDGITAIFMQFMFDAEFKARFVNGNFITEFRKWLKEIHK